MLPVLAFAGERAGEAISTKQLLDAVAATFSLTEAERSELLPSGAQFTFANRVGWACTYMRKAGLLTSPKKGFIQITEAGRQVLTQKPGVINAAFLKQFPSFVEFQQKHKAAETEGPAVSANHVADKTPHEILESSYQSLRAELSDELLEKVKSSTPTFFERLVVELLVKMGYGGSLADAGRAIGKSGDGGIDGIIKEDRLGLDFIFIQAKRLADKVVGRPDVQQFAGALAGHGAGKGIFITSSAFSKEACDYAAGLRNSKIVLIDGEELSELMIDHGIGVATAAVYEVKRVDSDYFVEDE